MAIGIAWVEGSWVDASWVVGAWNQTLAPPVFSGAIPDISQTFDTGTYNTDASIYFSDATSYSIAPAVETGWTFSTVTGLLTIDTDVAGTFAGYVVTGTNISGSDVSNAFSVIITEVTGENSGNGVNRTLSFEGNNRGLTFSGNNRKITSIDRNRKTKFRS